MIVISPSSFSFVLRFPLCGLGQGAAPWTFSSVKQRNWLDFSLLLKVSDEEKGQKQETDRQLAKGPCQGNWKGLTPGAGKHGMCLCYKPAVSGDWKPSPLCTGMELGISGGSPFMVLGCDHKQDQEENHRLAGQGCRAAAPGESTRHCESVGVGGIQETGTGECRHGGGSLGAHTHTDECVCPLTSCKSSCQPCPTPAKARGCGRIKRQLWVVPLTGIQESQHVSRSHRDGERDPCHGPRGEGPPWESRVRALWAKQTPILEIVPTSEHLVRFLFSGIFTTSCLIDRGAENLGSAWSLKYHSLFSRQADHRCYLCVILQMLSWQMAFLNC